MLGKFLKFLLSEEAKESSNKFVPYAYTDDGIYIDGKIYKMTDTELMIPAEKARVLVTASASEVQQKARRKVFQQIHTAIKQGKSKVRIEENHVKPETLEYFTSIGYTVERVTPPPGGFNDMGEVFSRDDDGEDIPGTQHAYFYYSLTWADSAPAGGGETLTAQAASTQTQV